MSQLVGLSKFCGTSNLGGILTIEYAPVAWINPSVFEVIRSAANNWQYDISFLEGDWLEAPILHGRTPWTETEQSTDQGTFYQQRIQGTTPKMLPSVTGELAKMSKHQFIIRLTDENDQRWIIGSLEHSFEFIAPATTSNLGGLNNYSLQWRSDIPKRAAGFEPVFSF